jgi:hypothetical protein
MAMTKLNLDPDELLIFDEFQIKVDVVDRYS